MKLLRLFLLAAGAWALAFGVYALAVWAFGPILEQLKETLIP